MSEGIDLVIPYVDSTDSNWQKLFDEYNPLPAEEKEGINARNRFRGQGEFFRYWFRCVERNLPWIRKIHLIVQSESQIPYWINKEKIHIVYHSDIIPEEYLPTFNSTCIEMFLWKIKGLSEQFIYANDDFYPIRKVNEDLFFYNNKVRLNSMSMRVSDGMYPNHCLNGYCLIYNRDKNNYIKNNSMVPSFAHKLRPYLKSKMEECFNKYKDIILNSLSRFREKKNLNIYLFGYYLIKNGFQEVEQPMINKCLSSKTSDRDTTLILSNCNMVALQDDNPEVNIYEKFALNSWFRKYYGNKSRYEV